MNTSTDPFGPTPGKRTTTVTVMCIIIFVFAGYATFSNLSDALSPLTPEQIDEQMAQSMEMTEKFMPPEEEAKEMIAGMMASMRAMLEKGTAIGWVKTLTCVGALLGAWMMWRMRRNGFHIYLVSAIIWAFAPMFIAGANVLTWGMAILYGIVVLVFALVLGSQRKYML